jgi:hypothetical protein
MIRLKAHGCTYYSPSINVNVSYTGVWCVQGLIHLLLLVGFCIFIRQGSVASSSHGRFPCDTEGSSSQFAEI